MSFLQTAINVTGKTAPGNTGFTGNGALAPALQSVSSNPRFAARRGRTTKSNTPTAAQNLISLADEQRADYQNRFVPLQNKFLQSVRKNAGDYLAAEGTANADAMQVRAQQTEAMRPRLLASGGDPANAMSTRPDTSGMMSTAMNNARAATLNEQDTGMLHYLGDGQGVYGDSNAGIRSAAAYQQQNSIANQQLNDYNNSLMMNALGSLATTAGGDLGWMKKLNDFRVDNFTNFGRDWAKESAYLG